MGIVTGIGDKGNNINVIKPEIDADLYKYILGKNAIIEGLEIVGNTLSAGMCTLCGYRGKLEQGKTIPNVTYIYGKFTLYFDNEIPDEFDIEFSNEQPIDDHEEPASITSAGTYYLLLYLAPYPPYYGEYILNSVLDTPSYPAHSYEADKTDLVRGGVDGAIIEDGVIATTQLRNDNSRKVATTEYVHEQIDEEINYQTQNINNPVNVKSGNSPDIILNVNVALKEKAKYVLLNTSFSVSYGPASTFYAYVIDLASSTILGTVNNAFIPKQNIVLGTIHAGGQDPSADTANIILDTNGNIHTDGTVHYSYSTRGFIDLVNYSDYGGNIGYETN